ncbi:MAG: Crp/Fnr family transcriptional regulator [Bacteroidales bacterium]|jgi:CRP-like cAMP-binding protein|nr:Crp/Fnr family transcriptional regulator [Bacteroidales bacterium]MDD4384697.1 Crp/Fnr family transcriptional regulator [Bacteroidales bacterium]MDY0196191.1 Crp/Fnr family transcriptional regulator [Tenuifilaceae bacterium]
MFEILSNSPFFIGLSAKELESIFGTIAYSVKSFSKGQTIAQRDDEVKNLLIVIEGIVKGEMVDFSGKILKVEEIQAPQPLAHAVMFSQMNKFPVDVVALTNCKILFIPRTDVLRLMQSNEIILKNFLRAVSNRAHFLTTKLWFLSFKTIKEKVAHYLLNLAKSETRTTIILPKSHQELAELFGVTRPSLARVLSEMEDDETIIVNRREVQIINKQKLLEMIK